MLEVTSSQKPNKSVEYIKKWMAYDPETMSDSTNLAAFYGNVELLIDEIEKSGTNLTRLKIQFHDCLGKYKKVMNILYPDPGIEETDEEPYFSQSDRISMRNEPMICEAKIFELMQEFKDLAEQLLELHEGEDDSEEKIYYFEIFGQDVSSLLESTVGHVTALTQLPDDQINKMNSQALYDQTSILLYMIIERGKIIGLTKDETDTYLQLITDAENTRNDPSLVIDTYYELKKLAIQLLDRIKISPDEKADYEEFQEIAVGSTLGAIVEGVHDTLKRALAKVKKPKDQSPDN